jgi:hypothetical protein
MQRVLFHDTLTLCPRNRNNIGIPVKPRTTTEEKPDNINVTKHASIVKVAIGKEASGPTVDLGKGFLWITKASPK